MTYSLFLEITYYYFCVVNKCAIENGENVNECNDLLFIIGHWLSTLVITFLNVWIYYLKFIKYNNQIDKSRYLQLSVVLLAQYEKIPCYINLFTIEHYFTREKWIGIH